MKAIGQDDKGEPIWQLTAEEYAQWEQQSTAARAKAQAQEQRKSTPQSHKPATEPESTPGAEDQGSHQSEAAAQNPQAMELGSKIWEWRKKGWSVYEIHRKLGIPMEAVKTILEEFEQSFYPSVGQAIERYAALDDQRLEDLMRRWLPVATGPAPEVEKVSRNGQPYTELDTETPVKAAGIVLGAIKSRIQLLMACRPESVNGKEGGQTNILLWLNQVMPGIQRVVSQVESAPVSRGRQNLVLECEAEAEAGIDSNGSKP